MRTKLLIIGGVAGGATAAARARRISEEAEIILFERDPDISFANCGLPYYVGNIIDAREKLFVTTPEKFGKRYNIDVRTSCAVIAIDRKKKVVDIEDRKTGERTEASYDKIIMAPGAAPVKLPCTEGEYERLFSLRNIADSDKIKKFLDMKRPKSAVIVGAGYIGLEMAENLCQRGLKVTIIEAFSQVLPFLDAEMAFIVADHLVEKGVDCLLESRVSSLTESADGITVRSNTGQVIETDLVISSIGIKPETKLAREAGLNIGKSGAIEVDVTMCTSDPDIYAVGDAVEIRDLISGVKMMTPLAGPAVKQARIAADNVLGRKSLFKGTIGTAIVKVFDLAIASTGASEKNLRANDTEYLSSYTHSPSHATYYPEGTLLSIKLNFAPGDGRILGAQIVGSKGVDKRIDVIATAIHAGLTVFDLEELELAYAPAYSSAKDPINMAGFVASNILKKDIEIVSYKDLQTLSGNNHIVLELRDKEELDAFGFIEGSLLIPLDELRDQLSELDRDKEYLIFCSVGIRSYIGHRILKQAGFKSKVFSGGYRTFVCS